MRIARVYGVEFRVSPFFLLLLLIYASVGLLCETLLVFWIVLLHELAHVAAAACFGIRTERVELLPFGGVASFSEPLVASPMREAVIAACGPAHNLVFAYLATMFERSGLVSSSLARFLAETNIAIGLFNLLPGIPLDGGRILRAALVPTLGTAGASRLASDVGRILGFCVLTAGGIMAYAGRCNVLLPVLGGFLVFAASREARAVSWARVRDTLRKKREFVTAGTMSVNLLAVYEKAHLKDVVRHFVPGKLNVVVVFDTKLVIRALACELDVIKAMSEHGPDALAATIAR